MASRIPNADLVELDGDDHLPWIGDTRAVFRPIDAFIGQIGEPAGASTVLATLVAIHCDEGWNSMNGLSLAEFVEISMDSLDPVTAGLADRLIERLDWMRTAHAVLLGRHRVPRRLTEIVRALAPSSPPITLRAEGTDVLIPASQVAPFATMVYHLLASSLEAGALQPRFGRRDEGTSEEHRADAAPLPPLPPPIG